MVISLYGLVILNGSISLDRTLLVIIKINVFGYPKFVNQNVIFHPESGQFKKS